MIISGPAPPPKARLRPVLALKRTDFDRKHLKKIIFNKKASINLDFVPKTENRLNIFKSFRLSLAKKRSRSRPKIIGSGFRSNFKSVPAPPKKPWLRPAPAPQHWHKQLCFSLLSFLNLLQLDSFFYSCFHSIIITASLVTAPNLLFKFSS